MIGDPTDLRTSGAAATWPRFERPSTDVVRPRSARGSRARVAGAKNADPSGALKTRSFVLNARPTAAEEPESRTSVRFADTDTTRSERARAHRRTALTVARDGAKLRLKAAGVSPWPRAAARASPALWRGASATVTGTVPRIGPVASRPAGVRRRARSRRRRWPGTARRLRRSRRPRWTHASGTPERLRMDDDP